MAEGTEIAVKTKAQTVNRTEELSLSDAAKIYFAAGVAREKEDLAKLMIKLNYGRSIGLSDVGAINGIGFGPNGTLVMSASNFLYLIKKSGKYRLEYKERNDKICTIAVHEKIDGNWYSLGTPISFSEPDAVKAGLASKETYKRYMRQMLTARCISDVFKSCCADACSGVNFYLPEEIDGSGFKTDPESGEMVPETEVKVTAVRKTKVEKADKKLVEDLNVLLRDTQADLVHFLEDYDVKKLEELTPEQAVHMKTILLARKKAK